MTGRALSIAIAVCSLATVVAALAPGARAVAQDRRAIVLGLSGPASEAVESEVRGAIDDADGWQTVDAGEVERAAARLGSDAGSREVAADVGASAVVDGRITRRGRRFTLRLVVRDASTGSELAQESFAGRNPGALRAEVRRSLWERVGPAMAQGQVPAAGEGRAASAAPASSAVPVSREEPSREIAEADVIDVGGEDAAPATAPSPLWVAVGGSLFSRDFSYTDDLFFALRPYQLPLGFAARIAARWYPGAHVTSDFIAHLGVDVSFGGAIGLRSRQRDGTTFPTESIDFRAGLDARIPLDPIELGVGISYGMHTFALGAADDGNAAQLPNVEYQFVRPALRARADLGAGIFVEGAFGWRFLTGTGGLSTWFPRSSGQGLDVGGYVGWESDLGIGARAGFELQRYFFSMNPEPGDPYIAGGAADQFLAGTVELVYHMR